MKKKILFTIIFIIFLYVCFVYFIVQKTPLIYSEIDSDNNKIITLGESFYAIELGEKNITIDGRTCIEYYHLKDGIPAKIICK